MENRINALSAVMSDISKTITTAKEQLSGLSQHPYDATKEFLFEKDYKFPTINDVEVPENVTTDGLIDKIRQTETNYQSTLLDYISNPHDYIVEGVGGNQLSLLAEPSGTNSFVVTKDKFKKYIEFLEVVRSIDINSITEDNSNEIIQKIGYSLVNCLNCQTVTK